VERLENQLSLYRPGSDIFHVNARAAREAVQVSPEVFALLQRAARLSAETGGAFDITVAPLVRCWGFMGGQGEMPSAADIADARSKVGMHLVTLDDARRTVRFAREGVMLDLGAIGKGYAVECEAELLREAGVVSALIHGGTSTICAIGHPPEEEAWKIAVDVAAETAWPTKEISAKTEGMQDWITFLLRDESLSVSAASGRQFTFEGRRYGHVLDPRTGAPTGNASLAAVALPSATETDAFSTALLTLGLEGQQTLANLRAGIKMMVVTGDRETQRISRHGFRPRS
jgi:FAD:protein FMN transferase